MAGILLALDRGDFAALALLDLSAAFDTVDHATLLRRLELSYGIRGTALSWLRSYLSERTQFVRSGSTSSRPAVLRYGVPQGSVLGPILFLLYTSDLIGVVARHWLCTHLYADDTQVCGMWLLLTKQVRWPTAYLCRRHCQVDGRQPTTVKRSQDLDPVMQLTTSGHQLPSLPFLICSSSVGPSSVVQDMGVWIYNGLTMSTHIIKAVAGCFALLQLRSVRRSLSHESFTRLVVALVLSLLDYCNGVLAGLPASQLSRL